MAGREEEASQPVRPGRKISQSSGAKPFPIRGNLLVLLLSHPHSLLTSTTITMARSAGDRTTTYVNIPHVIAMVGLPARGKTYIAKKLTRYLKWIGMNTRVFNVGEYRRQATEAYRSHDFFRPDNEEAIVIRNKCAEEALEDMCSWLMEESGEVAVYDATNTTIARRQMIYDTVVEKYGFKLFFVESICEDPSIIEANIRVRLTILLYLSSRFTAIFYPNQEVKVHSPDYTDMNKDEALKDFMERIEHYKVTYQSLDEELEKHLSFMRIFNAGEKVLVHRHEGQDFVTFARSDSPNRPLSYFTGHIQSRVVYYLMNIHIIPRSIYLTRHGESVFNLCGRIGGDSELSDRGMEYAKALAKYITEQNIPRLR